MGLDVLGSWDSPVMPIMTYNAPKMVHLSRECLKRHIAMVIVGFPATPVLLTRARLCISAAHSREDLDWCLEQLEQVRGSGLAGVLVFVQYTAPNVGVVFAVQPCPPAYAALRGPGYPPPSTLTSSLIPQVVDQCGIRYHTGPLYLKLEQDLKDHVEMWQVGGGAARPQLAAASPCPLMLSNRLGRVTWRFLQLTRFPANRSPLTLALAAPSPPPPPLPPRARWPPGR